MTNYNDLPHVFSYIVYQQKLDGSVKIVVAGFDVREDAIGYMDMISGRYPTLKYTINN